MAENKSPTQLIQDRAKQLVADYSTLHADYETIEHLYFMDESIAEQPSALTHQAEDIKLTISPNARNDIIGIVRLLTANEIQFEAKSEKAPEFTSEIERLCHIIVDESSRLSRGRIVVDAVRSTTLLGDTHLVISRVDELATMVSDDEKPALQELKKRTPILLEVNSATHGYPGFGRFGLRVYLRRLQIRGEQIKAEWQLPAGMQLDDITDYWLNDWYDLTNRFVWLDEFPDNPLLPLTAHKMHELPIAIGLADGSSLWSKPEQIRQPFLYAKYKGNWHKRENLFFTQLFTSLSERGSSILLGSDSNAPLDKITVRFAGPGVRLIDMPNAKVLSDSAFDAALMQIKALLDNVDAESTIYKQVLGSALGMEQMPYSAMAMLSQSGRLSTISVQESVQTAMSEIMEKSLRWIKREGLDLTGIVDMQASDIPDDFEIKATLEVKLPQDAFRNAQIAETMEKNGDVSKQWVRSNLLQIPDSDKMDEEIWTEQSAQAFYLKLLGIATQSEPGPVQSARGGMGGVGGVNRPAGAGAEAAAAGAETLPATEPIQPGAGPAAQPGALI